jgi:hypothetical protein
MRLSSILIVAFLSEVAFSAPTLNERSLASMNQRRMALPEAYAVSEPVGMNLFDKRKVHISNKVKNAFKKIGGVFKKIGCSIGGLIPGISNAIAKKCGD